MALIERQPSQIVLDLFQTEKLRTYVSLESKMDKVKNLGGKEFEKKLLAKARFATNQDLIASGLTQREIQDGMVITKNWMSQEKPKTSVSK